MKQHQNKPSIVALLGATASGKTEISLKIASKLPVEIVSLDAVQIYKYFDIGTAKPSLQQRQQTPHHLIDICEPNEMYSAGKYFVDASQAINSIIKQRKIPLLVGGNFLYYRVLLHGIAKIPPIQIHIKKQIRSLYAEHGIAYCYSELKKFDNSYAQKISSRDTQRILRALEVFYQTQKPFSEWQQQHNFSDVCYNVFPIAIQKTREEIYTTIEQRTYQMLKNGWIEETKNIMESYQKHVCPALQAIGYKQIVAYIENLYSYSTMIEEIQKKTRHYAKRQYTWLKSIDNLHWSSIEEITNGNIISSIQRFLSLDE